MLNWVICIFKENHKGAIEYFTKALKYAPDNNGISLILGPPTSS